MKRPTAMFHGTTPILLNRQIARDTFLLRVEAPALARAILPGQFVMLRLPGGTDPLLGRPFALYDTVLDAGGEPSALDIVYLVVGKLTRLLATLRPGDTVAVWGPLGNGFPDLAGVDHIAPGGRRHRPDTFPGPRPRPARGTRLRGRAAASPVSAQSRSITASARQTWLPAWMTSAPPVLRCIWRVTMAASAFTASSLSYWNSMSVPRGRATSSGAARNRCCTLSPTWPSGTACHATFPWKRRWHAASGSALAASPRSAPPTAGTIAVSASKALCSTLRR